MGGRGAASVPGGARGPASLSSTRQGLLSWHSACRSSSSTVSRETLPGFCFLLCGPHVLVKGWGAGVMSSGFCSLMSPCSRDSSVAPRAVHLVSAGCATLPAVGQLPLSFLLSQLPEPLKHPVRGSPGIQVTPPVTPQVGSHFTNWGRFRCGCGAQGLAWLLCSTRACGRGRLGSAVHPALGWSWFWFWAEWTREQ